MCLGRCIIVVGGHDIHYVRREGIVAGRRSITHHFVEIYAVDCAIVPQIYLEPIVRTGSHGLLRRHVAVDAVLSNITAPLGALRTSLVEGYVRRHRYTVLWKFKAIEQSVMELTESTLTAM